MKRSKKKKEGFLVPTSMIVGVGKSVVAMSGVESGKWEVG